jgi:hypothetical protein
VSLTLGDAAFKALTNSVFRKITSDKDDAAIALFIRTPWPLMVTIKNHVNALEHEALRVILERNDSLAPQNARSVFCNEILNPWKKLVGIERLISFQRNRLHLFVVVVLQASAVMVVVIMAVAVPVIMIVIVMMIIGIEERRLDFENAIEIRRYRSWRARCDAAEHKD